jgi:hypothetical protein
VSWAFWWRQRSCRANASESRHSSTLFSAAWTHDWSDSTPGMSLLHNRSATFRSPNRTSGDCGHTTVVSLDTGWPNEKATAPMEPLVSIVKAFVLDLNSQGS